ncbi:MAG TPA: cyclodeaminase/cyclohydrolase family protein, partial [candidate division Zixibacteria bacterium]|nr:cyclodeaminase/cyclohydrolase family protein [candidate division Zixibacteria bacterium]
AVGGLRAGVEPFLEQLAAPTAAPGGGSASAAAGAMAASLATMVATMSRGKKAYLQYENELSAALGKLSALREELKSAIDRDAEAFKVVMAAYKAAKQSDDGGAGIQAALQQATLVPLSVAEASYQAGQIAESLKPMTNPNMASDLSTAVALAKAAVTGALENVEINLKSLDAPASQTFVQDVRLRVGKLPVK